MPARKKDKPSQREAFINAARELGVDMSEDQFIKAMRNIAPAKRPPTKEEIARMSTKEKYDLFGTRFRKDHPK